MESPRDDELSVSVCMATHNGAQFLGEQLATILPQLAAGDELVVVDDLSSDGTMDILRRTAADTTGPSVRVYQNQINLGAIRSFERALGLATKNIVLLCDQDDRWMPRKVNRIRRAFAEDQTATLVLSDAQLIDEAGQVFTQSRAETKPFRFGLLSNLARNSFLGCAMAFERSSLSYCLPIPARIPMHDQWIGMLHTIFGKVVYVAEPLIQYRRHSANATADQHAPAAQMLKWRSNLLWNLAHRWWQTCRNGAP